MTLAEAEPQRAPSRHGRAAPEGVLVLGADYRALGIVRSLGRRGVRVWVVRNGGERLAGTSRYAERVLRWPSPLHESRLPFLEGLAEKDGAAGWVVIPTADETVAFVAREHDRLAPRFALTTSPWSVVRWAYDKRLMHALADRLGIECPRTALLGAAGVDAAADVGFPAVLKPAVKDTWNRLTNAKAWLVRSRDELERRLAKAATRVDPSVLMLQELVPGDGARQFSYAALCDEGVPLASLTARRTRQYPALFGRASTFVETAPCPDIVGPSEELLREIGLDGLVEVEYKQDPRDGRFKLLDVNARVWGWQSLCGRAGVDFPYLLWQAKRGDEIERPAQRDGVGWLRVSTDTPTALLEILARRLSLREYLCSLRDAHRGESAIFARDDPVPGLCEFPLVAYLLARRLLRR